MLELLMEKWMPEELETLLEEARNRPFSKAEREAQRRSFAFGNANIENPDVTREVVDAAAEALKNGKA